MMEISKEALTWNLGDTSFRRKALIHDYYVLLKELYSVNKEYNEQWNNNIQAIYYTNVRSNEDIVISSLETNTDKMSKCGRTFSSGLFKLGFCDKNRKVSEIGLQFLGKVDFSFDNFEERLGLKRDNIIFLRQLLKLYIWDKGSNTGFNPFIFLIKLLNRYDDLTKDQFESIIQAATGKLDFNTIVDDFFKVKNGQLALEDFFQQYIGRDVNSSDIDKFIHSNSLDEDLFKQIFYNRKTSTSKEVYLDFYKKLLDYKMNLNNQEKLDNLIPLIKSDIIKKAFGTNSIFDIRGKVIQCSDFNENFKEVPLLSLKGKDFRQEFLNIFLKNKREDIVTEYRDMTYRVFNTTGIINFSNNTVKINNLYAKEYFKKIDQYLKITINEKKSNIFKILSSNEILDIDRVKATDKLIRDTYKLKDKEDILKYLNTKERDEFKDFIVKTFDKKKVINILNLIKDRKDREVFNAVTDQTTIPTIFEYILGITWLYISDFKFDLYNSLNLALDSSYYPLSHAAGGDGDIVIDYSLPEEHKLMLEATLMDINTQKRGELEPVIRHSVNLNVDSTSDVYSIFIANELDNNVINIFRVCNLIELESSKVKEKYTNNTKIVALTISEVIYILENNINYDKILSVMKNEFKSKNILNHINNNWRKNFVNQIFN